MKALYPVSIMRVCSFSNPMQGEDSNDNPQDHGEKVQVIVKISAFQVCQPCPEEVKECMKGHAGKKRVVPFYEITK